jgi:hypothetical protein
MSSICFRRPARLPDAIMINVNELGGIRGTVDFVAACVATGVGFRFHSGETGVGSAAYLQLSAALEHMRGASQTLLRWYADDVIEGGPFVPRAGVVAVPEGPGLGVTLDPVALRRCGAAMTATLPRAAFRPLPPPRPAPPTGAVSASAEPRGRRAAAPGDCGVRGGGAAGAPSTIARKAAGRRGASGAGSGTG